MPQAVDDLEVIADFISRDSSYYASLFVMDILYAVDRLEDYPQSGRVVPEMNETSIRELIMGNYRIVYRIHLEKVEILTIFHGSKLLDPTRFT